MNDAIITVLTDFGYMDPYVGIMKGVMAKINPKAKIIDISHDVPSFSIKHAAFSLFSYYRYFPDHTVHLVVVDPGVGSKRKAIVTKIDKRYFVLPDNGVISYVWENEKGKDKKVFNIENEKYFLHPVSNTFHGRDIFAPIAAHISRNIGIEEFGKELEDPVLFPFPKPYIKDNILHGEVIYIDKFGTVVTNIKRDLLDGKELFCAEIKTHRICNFANYYGEYKEREEFMIFGSSNFLELSINRGSFSKKLKVNIGDEVKVIFQIL